MNLAPLRSAPLGAALSRWIKPTDFFLGAKLTFEMPSTGSMLFTLEVKGYDDYTKKIMETDKDEFPQSHTDLDIARISEKLVASKVSDASREMATEIMATSTNYYEANIILFHSIRFAPSSLGIMQLPIRTIFQEADKYGTRTLSAAVFKECVRAIEKEADANRVVKIYDLPDHEIDMIINDFGVDTDSEEGR